MTEVVSASHDEKEDKAERRKRPTMDVSVGIDGSGNGAMRKGRVVVVVPVLMLVLMVVSLPNGVAVHMTGGRNCKSQGGEVSEQVVFRWMKKEPGRKREVWCSACSYSSRKRPWGSGSWI